MDQLEKWKKQFLEIHAAHQTPNLPKNIVARQVQETVLSQMFLTIQPDAQTMKKLDTHLQPHFDPSTLTINLHLSPADYKGCIVEENGLLVFPDTASTKSVFHSTQQGTAVFLWQNTTSPEEGRCLHTANNITSGKRIVLCSFWNRRLNSVDSSGRIEGLHQLLVVH